MVLSSASRSASLNSPAATCTTRSRVVAVGSRKLGDALARATDPLALGVTARAGVVGQELLAADHRGDVDRQHEEHEQQQRSAEVEPERVEGIEAVVLGL